MMSKHRAVVRRSTIHGKGFFVARPIRRGQVIATLRGTLCTRARPSKNARDAFKYPDWVGVGGNTWLDPSPPYKFINHSCAPSAGIRGKTTMVARRALRAGDEVTLDYSTIEGDPRWHMKCVCKSRNCRKVIRSVQFLPYTVYKKYLPLVPTYFQKLYRQTKRKEKTHAAR